MLRLAVADFAVGVSESVTITVKLETPAVATAPEIAAVVPFKVNPEGRVPVVTAQV
jgi:hypothetical protein